MREGGLDGFLHLQYTNFQSLSDKESVIVSPVHTLRKKVAVLKRPPSTLVP